MSSEARGPSAPEATVVARNKAVLGELPFADRGDFADAERGFIATIPDGTIMTASGHAAWSQKQYDFIDDGAAPDSVNPSLWRIAQLNRRHGLFQVCEGVYQVRGLDIANMTIVEGKTGIIVIDTLTCVEAGRAAIDEVGRVDARRTPDLALEAVVSEVLAEADARACIAQRCRHFVSIVPDGGYDPQARDNNPSHDF